MAVFNRLEEAELARGLLESDGIPAALLDAQMAGLGLGPAVGGVRLLVPAWDEGRALDLLAPPPWSPEPALTPAGGWELERAPTATPTSTPAAPPVSRPGLVAWWLIGLAAVAWLARVALR